MLAAVQHCMGKILRHGGVEEERLPMGTFRVCGDGSLTLMFQFKVLYWLWSMVIATAI